MNAQEFAQMLNNRQYRNEMTKEEEKLAKENGLVVLFWASDDLAELRWAIDDEVGCRRKWQIVFFGGDLLKNDCDEDDCPYFEAIKKKCIEDQHFIDILSDCEGYWRYYKTDIPCFRFDILEEEEKYCNWLVFHISEILPKKKEEVEKMEITLEGLEAVREIVWIIGKVKQYATKFIDKVESGKAKSKETYSDMKELVTGIDAFFEKRIQDSLDKKQPQWNEPQTNDTSL